MNDFFQAIVDPDFPLLRYALLMGLLSSAAMGVVGSYVVTRRITYIAAAISHCVLGGIGAAVYCQSVLGWQWFDPLYGALASALLSALLMGFVSLYAKQREDTVISAVWSVGMAVGLLFLSRSPPSVDAMSYLFGSIVLVSQEDLWLVVVLDAVVAAVGVGFYPKFLALCFDEEFAELRGVRPKAYYLLLLCLTALAVVLLMRIVGIILVVALFTLPPAVAGQFARRLWQMMLWAVLFCALFINVGIAVSYRQNLPSGPVIVLLAGGTYLLAAIGKKRFG
ncbi:MAG: metal ABC transporter permease [Pirellulales bacterium]|nr:metal ABC transporter permease [Pirellulales bacterium]